MEARTPKKALHNSGLVQLWRCGEKFRRIYVEGEREQPSTSMVIGTGSDEGVSANLIAKAKTGRPLTPDETADAARDALMAAWDKGVNLDDEEKGEGEARVRGRLVDEVAALVKVHALEIAPEIDVVAEMPGDGAVGVQWKFVLDLPGLDYELHGALDVAGHYGGGYEIRDTKVRGKMPSKTEADKSQQLSMYSLALLTFAKELPKRVGIDALVRPGKRAPARKEILYSERDQAAMDMIAARIGVAIDCIENEIWTPANPEDWWCGVKYCSFARDGSCPYFWQRNTTTVAMPEPKKEDRDAAKE